MQRLSGGPGLDCGCGCMGVKMCPSLLYYILTVLLYASYTSIKLIKKRKQVTSPPFGCEKNT